MYLQRFILIYANNYKKDKGKMGQSMDSPKRSKIRNHPSRYSARSLQRSSRKSLLLEKRNSYSASKIQQNQNN